MSSKCYQIQVHVYCVEHTEEVGKCGKLGFWEVGGLGMRKFGKSRSGGAGPICRGSRFRFRLKSNFLKQPFFRELPTLFSRLVCFLQRATLWGFRLPRNRRTPETRKQTHSSHFGEMCEINAPIWRRNGKFVGPRSKSPMKKGGLQETPL